MVNLKEPKIRTIIVEDNIDSLNELRGLLRDIEYIDLIGESQNGKTAINIINRLNPELLFLDIQLPGADGFEILKSIHSNPMVIFVTAFDQYALKAFEVNGIDYILKPVSKERLIKAVERAIKINRRWDRSIINILKSIMKKNIQETKFSVKSGNQILIIPQKEVYYFKAEDKYVFLYTKDKKYFYNSTLKELTSLLDDDVFYRINKNHIISLNKVKKLKKNFLKEYKVVLDDQNHTSIKVSKYYLPGLRKKLNINIKI